MIRTVAGLFLLAIGSTPLALAQGFLGMISDPKPPVEARMPAQLPPIAQAQAVDLPIDSLSAHRYSVDTLSLAIDDERLVRYTLIVTSTGGARNVSYEAIRCDRRELQVLALGRADGSWSVLANPVWRPIRADLSLNRHHIELFTRLCEGGAAAATRPERLVSRLRQPSTIGP